VFFDTAGITWQYEPEGFESASGFRYLPDFYLPRVDSGVYFEVKGEEPDSRYQVDVVYVLPKPVIFAVGDVPGKMEIGIEDKSGNLWHYHGCIYDLPKVVPESDRWCEASFVDKPASRMQDRYLFPEAIRAARSARFEHGEAP